MDSVTAQLLAGAVADISEVRNRAVAKADMQSVMLCEQALARLVAVEAHEQGAGDITVRVRGR